MDHSQQTGRSARLAMRRLHHSGAEPIKVLLIGDRSHLLAEVDGVTLAERAADRMWLSTRHGVDLDVLTDLAPVLRAVQGVFHTWRLWRYDVVLVALGEGLDAAHRPRTLSRVGDLLGEVIEDAAAATEVVVVGPPIVPPEGSRHAAAPEDRLRTTVGRLGSARIRFRAVDRTLDDLGRARAWAGALGEEVTTSVSRLAGAPVEHTAAIVRDRPDVEADRQRALHDLGILGRPTEPRLDDLVELARVAFGTEAAEINFIDHDRLWRLATSGSERSDLSRDRSYCDFTIRRPGPTVVSDAIVDPLLRDTPMVRVPNPVRFYAAHPIESVDGYRIGTFCIYDHEPRDVRGLDLSVLRDLALMAQAEIISTDTGPIGVVPALVTGARH